MFSVITRLFEDKTADKKEEPVTSTTTEKESKSGSLAQQPPLALSFSEQVAEKNDELLYRDSFADLSSVNTSFNVSSSIASLNEIAQLLKRESLMARPKLAVEELLSLGNFENFLNTRTIKYKLLFKGLIDNLYSYRKDKI